MVKYLIALSISSLLEVVGLMSMYALSIIVEYLCQFLFLPGNGGVEIIGELETSKRIMV